MGKGDDPLGPATTTTVINPATEQPVAEVELTDTDGADELIAAAATAFPAWRDLAPVSYTHLTLPTTPYV